MDTLDAMGLALLAFSGPDHLYLIEDGTDFALGIGHSLSDTLESVECDGGTLPTGAIVAAATAILAALTEHALLVREEEYASGERDDPAVLRAAMDFNRAWLATCR